MSFFWAVYAFFLPCAVEEESERQIGMSHLHFQLNALISHTVLQTLNKLHREFMVLALRNLVPTGTASNSPSYPASFSLLSASSVVLLHSSSFSPAAPPVLHKRKKMIWRTMLLQGPSFASISNPTAGGCLSIYWNTAFFSKTLKAALDPTLLWRPFDFIHTFTVQHMLKHRSGRSGALL